MAIRLAKVFGSTSVIWVRTQAAHDLAVALREEGRIRVARYEPRPGS